MFCNKFIMKSYHMKFAQINIDVPNVQDILFAHVIVSNFLRDRKYSWATEVPDQWVSGAAARVYCRCDQVGEVGTHPTRISLFCRRAQEPADSLSLFLAGWSLPGWLEFCPGWLVSLLGLLNSQPGWLECLPGWLDSFLAGWSLSYICCLKLLADFGWNCSMAGLAI